MACLELCGYALQAQAAALQEQEEVIDQVGGLRDELVVRLRHRGERNFEAFLADLLRDAFRARGIQPRRVASLRALGDALRDDGFESAEKGQAGRRRHCRSRWRCP